MQIDYTIDNIISHGIPKSFYPYPHDVQKRLIAFIDDGESIYYNNFRNQLIKKFNDCGIKASSDNKIVFCLLYYDIPIYIGFYDWTISIGYGVRIIEY